MGELIAQSSAQFLSGRGSDLSPALQVPNGWSRQGKEPQKRSEGVQRHWGCGRSLGEPVRGRKHKVWSHGELQPRPSFPRKLPAPHPYHRTFKRVPVPLVAYEDKYGKNFSASPTLLRSAAACSCPGSTRPPLQRDSLSPFPSPNLSTLEFSSRGPPQPLPAAKGGGTSSGGAGSVPSLLLGCWNPMLSLPVLERFPCRISNALGSGWLNPEMNLYVLCNE